MNPPSANVIRLRLHARKAAKQNSNQKLNKPVRRGCKRRKNAKPLSKHSETDMHASPTKTNHINAKSHLVEAGRGSGGASGFSGAATSLCGGA